MMRRYGVHNKANLRVEASQKCSCGSDVVAFVDGKSVCGKCNQPKEMIVSQDNTSFN